MKKINVKGAIINSDNKRIYDYFGMESTCPNDVLNILDGANGEDIEVIINSGGGDVFAGSEIYTSLKDYKGSVTTKIVGIAASIASVIAMAGDRTLMSPTSQLMIHNVSAVSSGDYRDMEHAVGVLKNANETIANSYILKSGMGKETLLDMMNTEAWLTPQQALEKKFIDEIMFDKELNLVACSNSVMLPPEVINKVRNMIDNPLISGKNDTDILLQKAKLNLLKLKGDTVNE